MPKIRVSNKDRVEDDVMEEILQDPARFEELLREREKPPAKPVKKFVSPVPSRQSGGAYGKASGWLSQERTGRAG